MRQWLGMHDDDTDDGQGFILLRATSRFVEGELRRRKGHGQVTGAMSGVTTTAIEALLPIHASGSRYACVLTNSGVIEAVVL